MSHSRDLACGLLLLAIVAAMAEGAAPVPPPADAPNALTTLLPHQKGRAFCYVSNQAPVTYRLEDFPARKTPAPNSGGTADIAGGGREADTSG